MNTLFSLVLFTTTIVFFAGTCLTQGDRKFDQLNKSVTNIITSRRIAFAAYRYLDDRPDSTPVSQRYGLVHNH